MNEKLRAHVEELFKDAPNTKQAVEIKEEILQNTIDRYNDLIADGKNEQAAFNIAVAGIGNVDGLIAGLHAENGAGSYTRQEIETDRRRRAILLSVSVMLYILCVIPVILFEEYGVIAMFVMVAAATGLIIYRNATALNNAGNDTVAENFREWNDRKHERSSAEKAARAAVWAVTFVAYISVSFITMAWYITWIIFFIGMAADNIVRACFDLKR